MNTRMNATAPDPNRVTGPAGVRLVVPLAGGWAIQKETGPEPDDDPFEETRAEAIAWAREIVNATGTPFPPPRRSPNENPDALAKTTPVVLRRRPIASGHPVIGRYEYSAEDKPLRRSR